MHTEETTLSGLRKNSRHSWVPDSEDARDPQEAHREKDGAGVPLFLPALLWLGRGGDLSLPSGPVQGWAGTFTVPQIEETLDFLPIFFTLQY